MFFCASAGATGDDAINATTAAAASERSWPSRKRSWRKPKLRVIPISLDGRGASSGRLA
jgi:hypothetical protein